MVAVRIRPTDELRSGDQPAETQMLRDQPICPDFGSWNIRYFDVVRYAQSSNLESRQLRAIATDGLHGDLGRAGPEQLRFAFTLNLLADILDVGGSIRVVESEIRVSWPDWTAKEGRRAVQKALVRARKPIPLERLSDLDQGGVFARALDSHQMSEIMETGRFWLEPASQTHPSGVSYGEVFAVSLASWSMPYRGREGRAKRFVLVGSHESLGEHPVAVGLIEVGDDAPYNTLRDRFLTLAPDEVLRWARTQDNAILRGIAQRFNRLRSSLLPMGGYERLTVDEVIQASNEIEAIARGRSKSDSCHREKKRLAYLLRLSRGSAAFEALASGAWSSRVDRWIAEGARAIQNLIIPRIHMEVTVCGALPPFSDALGGKLVVSHLADPRVRSAVSAPPGEILRSLMDVDQYSDEMPRGGLLAVTTRGLYPGHSALYNRSGVPVLNGDGRFRKIGDTKGETTTLLSDTTARLAYAIDKSRDETAVSRTYGTGGAKRQRAFEKAALESGLPSSLVHAGIRRPMYAMALASNLPEIIWAGSDPEWSIDTSLSERDYAAIATAEWRTRWLRQSLKRLSRGPSMHEGTAQAIRVRARQVAVTEPTSGLSTRYEDIRVAVR